MPSIPTVPGTFQVQTPTADVKLDAQTLDAPNRARANMAQAIGETGQVVAGVAMKLQQAKNYGIAADVDRQMRQSAADFQLGLAGRTDEDKWPQEWKEKSDELWSTIQDQHPIGPDLKKQLTVNFKDWQTANGIEVKTLANKQSINRAVDRVGLAADEAARDGDELGIKAAFSGAVENHLLLPEVAAKMTRDYLTKVDEYAARNYIVNNPADAVNFLSAKDDDGKPANLTRLTPDQRMTLLNAAHVQFTKFQSDNYDDLIEGLQNNQVKTPEQLQALVTTNVISARQRRSYETAYRHGAYNTSVDEIGKTFSEITNYNPEDDPSFTKRASLLGRVATSGFPQNVQSEMNALLTAKSDPKHVLNSPVAKDAFEGIDKRFTLGLYGKFEKKVEDGQGGFKTLVDPKIFESAMIVKRRVEDATRKYLNEKPQATAEEVNRFVSDVQMTNVVRSGRQTILGGMGLAPTADDPAAKKARLDAILDKAKKK